MENTVLDSNVNFGAELPDAKYAGFWVRVGASILDSLILIPVIGLNLYNFYILKNYELQIILLIISTAYKPFMEFKYGATLGKMAVNIKVVNTSFESLTLSQAIIRYIPWLINQLVTLGSMVILFKNSDFLISKNISEIARLQDELISPVFNYIGSIILLISGISVAFSDKKQGMHDKMAQTYCIYK